MQLEPWQWLVALLAAFNIGFSKTGVAGLGILNVALFALVFPAKASTGIVLPILIAADVVAVLAYRRHAVWSHLWRIFPWAALGIVLGYFVLDHINNQQTSRIIGAILLGLLIFQWFRGRKESTASPGSTPSDNIPEGWWFAALMGVAGGFTTMVGNAAGPILILYLLAMRLPKMEFVGTAAWYFLILNCFKVPFSWNLDLINAPSLAIDLRLIPAAILGALYGRVLLKKIDQKLFENLAIGLSVLAAIRLLMA